MLHMTYCSGIAMPCTDIYSKNCCTGVVRNNTINLYSLEGRGGETGPKNSKQNGQSPLFTGGGSGAHLHPWSKGPKDLPGIPGDAPGETTRAGMRRGRGQYSPNTEIGRRFSM